jgi:hypothetical protein
MVIADWVMALALEPERCEFREICELLPGAP